jgi:hypothetical protein
LRVAGKFSEGKRSYKNPINRIESDNLGIFRQENRQRGIGGMGQSAFKLAGYGKEERAGNE